MIKTNLPVLILRDIVLFPQSEVRLEIEDIKTKELISLADSYYNKHILIIHQKTTLETELDINSTKIGILAYLSMKIDLPNQKMRIVVKGLDRVKIDTITKEDDLYISQIEPLPKKILDHLEEIAYKRTLIKEIEYYIENNSNASNSIISRISNINDIDKLTDILAPSMPTSISRKLEYLYELDPTIRVKMILKDISQELQIVKLEEHLSEEINIQLEESQKKYLLEEKLKVIKEELGLSYDKEKEIEEIKEKIDKLDCPKKIKKRLTEELNRYEITPITSPEVAMVRNYIDTLLSLPWHKKTEQNKTEEQALKILNKSHYGLEKVKEYIIEYLLFQEKTSPKNAPIICLVGPPGVGKTTLAKSIAQSMNKEYVKISVGGLNDEAEIMGHRRTYIASSPGKIINGMKKAGTINPVFVIDEVDKISNTKSDPTSCLLEVLDKEQNKRFTDNYVEEEYDLSQVTFILTANYKEQIPRELYDRLEIIELSSYTEYEKLNIGKNYIIPKILKNITTLKEKIEFQDKALIKIINNYTKEAGVRELERQINRIIRKVLREKSNDKIIIDEEKITKYLGKEIYQYTKQTKEEIGIVNALSYSIYGGDILKVEANYFPGNKEIITTGSLGEVFKESVQIALSYIKSNYDKLNINIDTISKSDIHIHVPSASIKKEGPSAGVALTTAIISAFQKVKVPTNIAFTGEITIRGHILPIGGLKEKIIGAKRAGVKTIYLPIDNKKDLEEIEQIIKEDMEFILVENYEEVYKKIFIRK